MVKIIFGIIVGVLLVIFIAQNLIMVDITFLVWTITINRGVMILIVLIFGIALGWIIKSFKKKKVKNE